MRSIKLRAVEGYDGHRDGFPRGRNDLVEGEPWRGSRGQMDWELFRAAGTPSRWFELAAGIVASRSGGTPWAQVL